MDHNPFVKKKYICLDQEEYIFNVAAQWNQFDKKSYGDIYDPIRMYNPSVEDLLKSSAEGVWALGRIVQYHHHHSMIIDDMEFKRGTGSLSSGR